MMMAWELGMTKGDYVFYTIEMLPEENVLNPEDVWASSDGNNVVAKEAFEAVFHVRYVFRFLCFLSPVHRFVLLAGSIGRSAKHRYLSYSEGDFSFFFRFSPRRGDTLHRWG